MDHSDSPDGHLSLQKMVDKLIAADGLEDKTIPIVLVPGFSGWGSPLFGAVNYWGGIQCIPQILSKQGYSVIVSPIAPLSSNWERACELYSQLTFGKFSLFNEKTNDIEDSHDVNVDYGSYFAADPDNSPETSYASGRKRAILFSKSPDDFAKWSWSNENKVHFVCHSQGGNTVRYLVSLMARGAEKLHPEYFSEQGRDTWTVSVTTLGTPHRGTTIINVLENLVPSNEERIKLLARSFATICFQDQQSRAYDLQLDHWGLCRGKNESFADMRQRFELDSGPVAKWLRSNRNGFYDNSIEGVHNLNLRADPTSKHIYYFSLSFHSTVLFPTEWPDWTLDAINTFPIPLVSFIRKVVQSVPLLSMGSWVIDRLLGNLLHRVEWKILSSAITLHDLAAWLTSAVANRLLQAINSKFTLPPPGKFLPRSDVIPPMMATCYAMSGQDLSPGQRDLLGPSLGDWFQNDGIVNTESMRGPGDEFVKDICDFPLNKIRSENAKGVYWHFGTNDSMDHADEIGVFVEEDTSHATRDMYLKIASLVSFLPSTA